MLDTGTLFIELSRRRLADLLRRAEAALAQLSDADVNWRPDELSNSIANLVLHLEGNFRQRFVHILGGEPDVRDRDAEFESREPLTREQAHDRLQATFTMAEHHLSQLSPERLTETIAVRQREQSLMELLLATVNHAAEHVGQILYIAKLRRGTAYTVVSIPPRR